MVEEATLLGLLDLAVVLVDGPPQATNTTAAPAAVTRIRICAADERVGGGARFPITFGQGRAHPLGDQGTPRRLPGLAFAWCIRLDRLVKTERPIERRPRRHRPATKATTGLVAVLGQGSVAAIRFAVLQVGGIPQD